ncbi:hypothetical protein [Tengunoibacter tsumagoiensis]|uniref:hypothetical protein n=1 Tax=Tengunoibacter tsumagoiensis TaxID=2014871 RepID=UPI001386F750|nr:hypothetical protein [Tengunoibacter tsumagoiensis]
MINDVVRGHHTMNCAFTGDLSLKRVGPIIYDGRGHHSALFHPHAIHRLNG